MSNNINHFPLWVKYKNSQDESEKKKIKQELVKLYYPLVNRIAYKLAPKLNWKVSVDELTSFGIDGLYIAIDKFDLERKIKFESYAPIRIYGSMIDCLRKEDRVPRTVRINSNKYEEIKNKLESKKGNKALDNEILKIMGITEKEYLKNMKKYNPVSFSSIDNINVSNINGENDCLHNDQNSNLIDTAAKTPDSTLIRKEFFNKLLGKNFSKLERKIIYMYYYENLTMDKISKQLKMSESRVSQLHTSLIEKLKDKINRNPNYFSDDIYNIMNNSDDSEILF